MLLQTAEEYESHIGDDKSSALMKLLRSYCLNIQTHMLTSIILFYARWVGLHALQDIV